MAAAHIMAPRTARLLAPAAALMLPLDAVPAVTQSGQQPTVKRKTTDGEARLIARINDAYRKLAAGDGDRNASFAALRTALADAASSQSVRFAPCNTPRSAFGSNSADNFRRRRSC
ncbi:hypothetical protein X566_12270 [Afipia sp. P52-10]|uniref:hypothetical protein n=1 Tax=Afipia sp. P52-10 TaxID=1429916 RepID=UPI0003DEFB0C|nr:hypothetical protein [Afipia sp. P52-10]ETR79097.1 hypothetical protein X566_12270 [Afipia sp. P52-10]